MLIESFEFTEKKSGWRLSESRFDPFTLMVGASGVGKTKILYAIDTLPDMADGKSYNGIKWRAVFRDKDQTKIVWEGETEETEESFDFRQMPFYLTQEKDKAEFIFLKETMLIDGKEIFRRSEEGTFYAEKPTVKLQKTKSLLHLLEEEKVIAFREKISKIYMTNYRLSPVPKNMVSKYDKLNSIDDIIQDASMLLPIKLFIISEKYPEIFAKIKSDFLEIFPFVEDIKLCTPDFFSCASHTPRLEVVALQLRERNSKHWVCIWDFSSGMHKTIALLAAIHLAPKGTIFLIDEFENSFGVNCIDAISDKIYSSSPENQFILTSHHPYIINKIPVENWRLVTRHNNTVNVAKVEDEYSTSSRHEAFIQLINLDQYAEGVTS